MRHPSFERCEPTRRSADILGGTTALHICQKPLVELRPKRIISDPSSGSGLQWQVDGMLVSPCDGGEVVLLSQLRDGSRRIDPRADRTLTFAALHRCARAYPTVKGLLVMAALAERHLYPTHQFRSPSRRGDYLILDCPIERARACRRRTLPEGYEIDTAKMDDIGALTLHEVELVRQLDGIEANPATVRAGIEALVGGRGTIFVSRRTATGDLGAFATVGGYQQPPDCSEGCIFITSLRSLIERTGLGAALLARIAEDVPNHIGRLRLMSRREDRAALAFYERVGFAPTGLIALEDTAFNATAESKAS